MSKLEENTSLVTALTEIEKKVGQAEIDRNTLKTNLSAKGVDVSGTDKMQGLVEKVNEIQTYTRTSGSNCSLYNIQYRYDYLQGKVTDYLLLKSRVFTELSSTIKDIKLGAVFCNVSQGSRWTQAYIKLVHIRGDKEINSFTSDSSISIDSGSTLVTMEVQDIQNGDIISIYYKTPNSGSYADQAVLASIGLYCNLKI